MMKMMKKFKLTVALLAAASFSAAPVFADVGKPGKVHWNVKGDIQSLLLAGNTVCDGTKWIWTCASFTKITQEVQVQYGSRQRHGVGVNITSVRYVRATAEGYVERDEAGNIITTLSKTAAVENGKARIYSVLGAAVNGIGSAFVAPLACELAGACGDNGGGGATAIAITSAEAASGSSSSSSTNNSGCAPSACAPNNNQTHSQNGPGN